MKFHKQIGNRGFTLVELMIVIVIIGVLAALASFGFMQYVKKSKTAEADEFVKKLADGSRAYFTSEQKYGGDENYWNAAGGAGTATAAGIPVPYNMKVYPGGTGWDFSTHAIKPQGGTKSAPDLLRAALDGAASQDKSALKKLQFNVTAPTYFLYQYQTQGTGNDAQATITATADFDGKGADDHTVTQILTVQNGEVLAPPPVVTNEFE